MMPHITVEYSSNIRDESSIPELLSTLSDAILAQRDDDDATVFPIGGLRARAIGYDDYRIADDQGDYAFVHVMIRIGPGRSAAVERQTVVAAFDALTTLFEPLASRRALALSLELTRSSEELSLKRNNIHSYISKKRD